MKKYSIKDFEREFPDDGACLEWLKNNRWPDGIHCIKCQRITKHYKVSGRSAYACEFCGNHVYPMAGTILDHSSTELRKWFHAMFLMSTTRCGISAKQLEREVGVTYKTAWRMFRQIRSMLDEDVMKLLGEVEVDETYVGGKRRGKRGRGAEGKIIVVGAAQRNGKVIAKVVPDVKRSTLVPFVTRKVSSKNTILIGRLQKERREVCQRLAELDEQVKAVETTISLIKHNGNQAEAKTYDALIEKLKEDKNQGKTQMDALITTASAIGNKGAFKVRDAKRVMISAGLIKNPKNADSVIYALIDRSDRFEKVRPGQYKLIEAQQNLPSIS